MHLSSNPHAATNALPQRCLLPGAPAPPYPGLPPCQEACGLETLPHGFATASQVPSPTSELELLRDKAHARPPNPGPFALSRGLQTEHAGRAAGALLAV